MSTPSTEPILDVAAVCGELGVSEPTVLRLIHTGRLRAARVGAGRGHWRIRQGWLTDYLERTADQSRRCAGAAAP